MRPEGEVVVGQQAQLGRRESQRVEKRLVEGFALGHEQRVLQPLHTRPAKAVVGVVSEHRKADKRHVLLIGGVEHLLGQLDITLVGLEDFARIAAQVAQFHERDHPRKKQQADDTQKTDRHSSAHTRHTSFDFINANIVN